MGPWAAVLLGATKIRDELAAVHTADRRDYKRQRDRAEKGENQWQFHGWGALS
jgi:hypothetical protein